MDFLPRLVGKEIIFVTLSCSRDREPFDKLVAVKAVAHSSTYHRNNDFKTDRVKSLSG